MRTNRRNRTNFYSILVNYGFLTLLRPVKFSIKLHTVKSGSDGPLYILRGHRLLFQNKIHVLYFFPRRLIFVCANSVDPDEMPHYVAFHLGLRCLPKYLFRVTFPFTKG